MPQSLVQIYVHIVYSTKYRLPIFTDDVMWERMHAYLAGVAKQQDCPPVEIGGATDHVHLLCRLGKTVDISTLIRELKRDSSKWIKTEYPRLHDFHWQNGYGAFSISPKHVGILTKYIRDQMKHHKTESFQDEFRRLCQNTAYPLMNATCGTDAPSVELLRSSLGGESFPRVRSLRSRPWALL